jgi:hypothetical protein
MNIEEIEKQWEEDSKIDETSLLSESAKIPKLHSKYYKLYFRAAMKLQKLKAELLELEKLKIEYYNGTLAEEDLKERGWKPNPLKILRTDINRYVEADKDIIELSLRIAYHSEIATYLENIIKQINNRNFIIKNMIDWLKFSNGIN